MRLFDPQPDASERPPRFPDPFAETTPHPWALVAARALMRELEGGTAFGSIDHELFRREGGGKMFGVLVVADDRGRIGWLKAFSGVVEGRWIHDGFAPPVFDPVVRESVELPGERGVKRLIERAREHAASEKTRSMRDRLGALASRHSFELDAMRGLHARNREQRREVRLAMSAGDRQLHALDQESRRDKAERRRLDERHDAEREELDRAWGRFDRRAKALERLRQHVCRRLMQRIHDTYVLSDANGETRALRSFFDGREPPSGAGDCAGPKLLMQAYRLGVRPIALAEFWWGAPPLGGGRLEGVFYPACREKCGPILPFMLRGLDVDERPSPVHARIERIPAVFEDERLVVFDKPEGLLSVPGKGENDSLLAWLRRRHPSAYLAHRLDQDTSGLVVAAKDEQTYKALQRQFAERTVIKRYVALVEGRVARDEGRIELPMRVDLEARPRQIVDFEHGLSAVTDYRVETSEGELTRVSLFPHTGRTHQLRVHCAHPKGLSAPIVGDRLYGRSGVRLMLHAAFLSFLHPATGEIVRLESPAPF